MFIADCGRFRLLLCVLLLCIAVAVQLTGQYKVKSEVLRPLFNKVQHVRLCSFEAVTPTHVLRQHNKVADALGNIAMDAAEVADDVAMVLSNRQLPVERNEEVVQVRREGSVLFNTRIQVVFAVQLLQPAALPAEWALYPACWVASDRMLPAVLRIAVAGHAAWLRKEARSKPAKDRGCSITAAAGRAVPQRTAASGCTRHASAAIAARPVCQCGGERQAAQR